MKKYVQAATLMAVVFSAGCLRADPITILGSAASYAVLGGAGVTNTGVTVLYGNLGVSPGSSITGFPPGSMSNGSIHDNDSSAAKAQADAAAAFGTLAGMAPTSNLSGQNLGGLTLTPGVFSFSTSASLNGTLTLDFGGASNQVFVFQTGTSLTAAAGSVVTVINLGSNDDVYFEVGSSATIGSAAQLDGYLVANTSITVGTGASIASGDLIALTGAVTLDTNRVSIDVPAAPVPGVGSAPEPASFVLLGTGVIACAWRRLGTDNNK